VKRPRVHARDAARALSVLIAALLVAGAFGAGVGRAGSYPTPLPDFAHPASPHAPQLSVTGAKNSRKVLVVYVVFKDLPAPPSRDAAYYAKLFFGPGFGSVSDYFSKNSFGAISFTPAPETSGAANDGVVTVELPSWKSYWAETVEQRGRDAVAAADPYVDYSQFDRNHDGKLTNDEFILVNVVAHPTLDCGGTRGIAAGSPLDGMDLSTHSESGGVTATNPITFAHEISHQAFDITDFDYFEGSFDLHGATCGVPDDAFWSYDSWKKLHFGWIKPRIVVKDGYYDIGRWDTTGQAYLLYDPAKGTADYYLVENRERLPGYDNAVSDSGLVIWRVAEHGYPTPPPYAIVPPVASSPGSAWNPDDPTTPQRTMSLPWRDGSPSNVAVRAIHGAGDPMRAYLDVRGPGILVDTYGKAPVTVRRGETATIQLDVRNTGEAGGKFRFTLGGLPSGETATPTDALLEPQVDRTVNVTLTTAATTAPGTYVVTARGEQSDDSTVSSSDRLTITVVDAAPVADADETIGFDDRQDGAWIGTDYAPFVTFDSRRPRIRTVGAALAHSGTNVASIDGLCTVDVCDQVAVSGRFATGHRRVKVYVGTGLPAGQTAPVTLTVHRPGAADLTVTATVTGGAGYRTPLEIVTDAPTIRSFDVWSGNRRQVALDDLTTDRREPGPGLAIPSRLPPSRPRVVLPLR
jgi:M6 family metalloprotease-like protein